MTKACSYCFTKYDVGTNHLYECPILHERIYKVTKKGGRLVNPLTGLSHSGKKGIGRPEICNCKNCFDIEMSDNERQ